MPWAWCHFLRNPSLALPLPLCYHTDGLSAFSVLFSPQSCTTVKCNCVFAFGVREYVCSYLSLLLSRVGRVQAHYRCSASICGIAGAGTGSLSLPRALHLTLIPATCWSGCEDVTPDKSRALFPVPGWALSSRVPAGAPSTLHVRRPAPAPAHILLRFLFLW